MAFEPSLCRAKQSMIGAKENRRERGLKWTTRGGKQAKRAVKESPGGKSFRRRGVKELAGDAGFASSRRY